MVKDGITLIIGGLMKDEKIETKAGIPFLKDLPFVGLFFGRKSYEMKKTELIVFLTPRIITGDVNMLSTTPEADETIFEGKDLKGFDGNGTNFEEKDFFYSP